jgi:hypothetical protein
VTVARCMKVFLTIVKRVLSFSVVLTSLKLQSTFQVLQILICITSIAGCL